MMRSLLCCLLFLFVLPGSSLALAATPKSHSIQESHSIQVIPNEPKQVGPWLVLVQRASLSPLEDASVLDVQVKLRNTSATSQSLASDGIFTCYRADVWQSLAAFDTDSPLPAVVASGDTAKGTLSYQLPPDVLSFGLVFFWQVPSSASTGIWSLQL